MTIYPLMKFGKFIVYPGLCIIGAFTCIDIIALVYILFCYHEQDKWIGVFVLVQFAVVGILIFILTLVKDLKHANMTLGISSEGITVFYKKKPIDTFLWSDVCDCGICHIYKPKIYHTNKMLYFSKQPLTDTEKLYLDTCVNEKMICLSYNESLLDEVQTILSKDLEVYYYTKR